MSLANTIPYMAAPGSIVKILEKIKEAGVPENFNSDFLSTKLGFKGGNYRTFISWAKKAGMLNSDGTPTQLYKKFRNPVMSGKSIAQALRNAYGELYSRNEYCYELNRKEFKGLVMEATGEASNSRVVENIVSTFLNAKTLANFDVDDEGDCVEELSSEIKNKEKDEPYSKSLSLGLNYTINLVLPKTDDPAIYNAIFKSLRENLLNE